MATIIGAKLDKAAVQSAASLKVEEQRGSAIAATLFDHVKDEAGKLKRFLVDISKLHSEGRKAFRVSVNRLLRDAQKETKKTEPAPAQFNVKFETSKGDFVVEIHKDWAPLGADRFYELVQDKFFDDARFFRAIKGFIVQFGINGDPKLAELWRQLKIADDPVRESNRRGTITYATAGPGTRKISA